MAPGLFTLMRKNWKKSIVYLGSASTALWFVYDYSLTNDVMKASCRKASLYGDHKLIDPLAQPRHITVILNPVACKRKSKKLYAKWVEPILHLAGIKVSLIETERPLQAYELMKVMSNCDGVAIVGGDGTVHEAINGLLSREDAAKAVKEFPIGIMPAGQYNSIARYIHQNNITYRNQKEFLIHATIRLVDSCITRHDVLKITPLNEELRSTESPIYAIRDVRYGKYQDNFYKLSGYSIYQNYVKPYWLRLQRMFSSKYPYPQIESLSYTEPCVGCSRCYEKHRIPMAMSQDSGRSANRRWWEILAPVSKPALGLDESEKKELELSKTDNPECDRWLRVENTNIISDFRGCMMGDKKVRMSLSRHGDYTPTEITETQDLRLKLPSKLDEEKILASQNAAKAAESKEISTTNETDTADQGPDTNEALAVSKVVDEEEKRKKMEAEARQVKFLIDGQPVQAHSIEITSLIKAIGVFTGPYKHIDTRVS